MRLLPHLTAAACLLQCACAAPLDVEGERVLQEQTAQNAIPRLGRRSPAPLVDLPSFTSGYMPNLPAYLSQRMPKRTFAGGNADLRGQQRAYVPGQRGNLLAAEAGQQRPNMPGQAATGVLVAALPGQKRGRAMPYGYLGYPHGYAKRGPIDIGRPDPKRSAIAEDWSSAWDNVLRSPQGFRLHDGNSDYFSNFVMYKRAKDFTSELNSVPMLGKRDPEPYAAIGTIDDDSDDIDNEEGSDDDLWASEEGGNIMGDVSLYPSVVSPHLRTILTRVQRSPRAAAV